LPQREFVLPKPNKKTETVKADAWFVYILRCSDGSLYTGITKDVKRRSEQHNAGTASRYTRSRLPVQVEYQEPHATRSLALKREAEINAMARLSRLDAASLRTERIEPWPVPIQ
jgi:predicted GIY-YIG superfamily endonuclease